MDIIMERVFSVLQPSSVSWLDPTLTFQLWVEMVMQELRNSEALGHPKIWTGPVTKSTVTSALEEKRGIVRPWLSGFVSSRTLYASTTPGEPSELRVPSECWSAWPQCDPYDLLGQERRLKLDVRYTIFGAYNYHKDEVAMRKIMDYVRHGDPYGSGAAQSSLYAHDSWFIEPLDKIGLGRSVYIVMFLVCLLLLILL